MATFMVTYDLIRPGKDYSKLYDAIKSLGSWWHYLDSTWFFVSSSSAKEIRDELLRHVDGNDKILVLRSGKEAAWSGISNKGSDWLKNNL